MLRIVPARQDKFTDRKHLSLVVRLPKSADDCGSADGQAGKILDVIRKTRFYIGVSVPTRDGASMSYSLGSSRGIGRPLKRDCLWGSVYRVPDFHPWRRGRGGRGGVRRP